MLWTRILLALGLAASFATAYQNTSLLPPSQDPWYQAPVGYETATPGSILRLRPAPGNLTTVYGNASSAWNILYRTTDSNYQPSWAVTTLFAPMKQNQKQNHTQGIAFLGPANSSLVSYQIPYNSADLDSSPSYALTDPTYASAIVGSDIQTLLSWGTFVNVPDHEGPLASFACGVSEGHATLDSIRAVKSLTPSQLAPQHHDAPGSAARTALWGYSGGSIASAFASELAVAYAPDLDIAGTAIGGLVTNGTTTILLASGGPFAGLFPAGLIGLSRQHAELNATLHRTLKPSGPYNASGFFAAAGLSDFQFFPLYAGQDMGLYFDGGLDAITPALAEVADVDVNLGFHGTPRMPMYVYKAVADELCPIGQTDELVRKYCEDGVRILYERNTVGGHLAEETNGDAAALGWLAGVLVGKVVEESCVVRDVSYNVTDSAL